MSIGYGLPTLITLGIRIHSSFNDKYTFFYILTPRLPFSKDKDDDLSTYHNTLGVGYILKKWENVKIIPNIAYIKYNYVMHEDLPNQEEWYFK
ncbi:MAG: hypothetical protein ACE5D0_10135, partial [Fidelibacterota bacterium]